MKWEYISTFSAIEAGIIKKTFQTTIKFSKKDAYPDTFSLFGLQCFQSVVLF